MFDNIQFLDDLALYCAKKQISFIDLNYTEQMACIRSMLVGICRNKHF